MEVAFQLLSFVAGCHLIHGFISAPTKQNGFGFLRELHDWGLQGFAWGAGGGSFTGDILGITRLILGQGLRLIVPRNFICADIPIITLLGHLRGL